MYQDFAGIPAVLGPLGWPEILLILFVVMLLFGAKRLPDLARGFGKSIKEFKKATSEIEQDLKSAVEDDPEPPRNGKAQKPASPEPAAAEPKKAGN